jgi:hypothetical protein
MKLYYLLENNESVGPFSIEELKVKNITTHTPVWCEGFDNWKTASEINALQSILIELPKPLVNNSEADKQAKLTFFGFNKKAVLIALTGLLLILFTLALMNYQSNKIIDIEKTNNETQKENYQKELDKQNQKIEAQNKVLTEKELIEQERFNNSRLKADENTYNEILSAISNCYKELENSKNELEKAKGYRLFRSEKKKIEQINEAENEIEYWSRKIELLKLEKIQIENSLNR